MTRFFDEPDANEFHGPLPIPTPASDDPNEIELFGETKTDNIDPTPVLPKRRRPATKSRLFESQFPDDDGSSVAGAIRVVHGVMLKCLRVPAVVDAASEELTSLADALKELAASEQLRTAAAKVGMDLKPSDVESSTAPVLESDVLGRPKYHESTDDDALSFASRLR